MIIQAKFASTCPKCGHPIPVGEKIEWVRGAKATHVTCPTTSSAPPRTTAAPKIPAVEVAPYIRAEKWAPCKRTALADLTGDVLVSRAVKSTRPWAGIRKGAAVEPVILAGEAFFVVAQTAEYESAEMNEDAGDMSGAGWHVTLYLRRATDEEAAPALAKFAAARVVADAKAIRADRIKELQAIAATGWRTSDDVPVCRGREVELKLGVIGSGRIVAILNEEESAVAIWCSGYHDDYRQTMQVTQDPRAVEIMRALLAE